MEISLAADRLASGTACLLVVSDVRFVGQMLAAVLERDPAVAAVRVGDPVETTAHDLTAQVDAVLVHTELREGPAVVRRLRSAVPHVPIVAWPIRETDEEIIGWAEAGATGYIPAGIPLDQFVGVLKGILTGEQVCSGRVAALLLRRVTQARLYPATDTSRLHSLTRRERQVADLVASRLDDKAIAEYLNIGVATAKSHVHNVLRKLQVRRRRDVVDALSGPHPNWFLRSADQRPSGVTEH